MIRVSKNQLKLEWFFVLVGKAEVGRSFLTLGTYPSYFTLSYPISTTHTQHKYTMPTKYDKRSNVPLKEKHIIPCCVLLCWLILPPSLLLPSMIPKGLSKVTQQHNNNEPGCLPRPHNRILYQMLICQE